MARPWRARCVPARCRERKVCSSDAICWSTTIATSTSCSRQRPYARRADSNSASASCSRPCATATNPRKWVACTASTSTFAFSVILREPVRLCDLAANPMGLCASVRDLGADRRVCSAASGTLRLDEHRQTGVRVAPADGGCIQHRRGRCRIRIVKRRYVRREQRFGFSQGDVRAVARARAADATRRRARLGSRARSVNAYTAAKSPRRYASRACAIIAREAPRLRSLCRRFVTPSDAGSAGRAAAPSPSVPRALRRLRRRRITMTAAAHVVRGHGPPPVTSFVVIGVVRSGPPPVTSAEIGPGPNSAASSAKRVSIVVLLLPEVWRSVAPSPSYRRDGPPASGVPRFSAHASGGWRTKQRPGTIGTRPPEGAAASAVGPALPHQRRSPR